jgi:DNA-binding response OmpR family regulator
MARKHILLVDDEPLIARLHSRAVQALGFTAEVAKDGYEALDMVARHTPDLLITDLNMPSLSGLMLTQKLIARKEKYFPVLLMSADDTVPILTQGLEAGIDDFLVKGMPFSMLTDRLRFWSSGYWRGIPDYIRAEALALLSWQSPLGPPIRRLRAPITLLLDRTRLTMVDLLMYAAEDFGTREVELIRFAGALDGVLARLSRANVLAHLRRLDVMEQLIMSLKVVWRAHFMAHVFPRLEHWSHDPTFKHAYKTLSL